METPSACADPAPSADLSPSADIATHADMVCTVCGCLCDDLRLTVRGDHVTSAEGACALAAPWFAKQGAHRPPVAEIAGRPASLDEALAEAARVLAAARAPLVHGLSRSATPGQRAAVRLAEVLGACVDTTASLGHGASVMAVQEVGESTCSLGEARNRADLVVYWGANPAVTHPRHFERCAGDALGEFLPRGRADRQVLVVDVVETETCRWADRVFLLPSGKDFEALWTLRLLLAGQTPEPGADTGAPPALLAELLRALVACRYGVVFFGFGLSRAPQGHRAVEALLRLVRDLNAHTRFAARRMRGSGDVTGADTVLAWQTGFPFAVNLARGYPRYNPGEYSAQELLARGEVDACLLVGSYGARRFHADAKRRLRNMPVIVLDPPTADPPLASAATFEPALTPAVKFTTATYGLHAPGTAYRMDEIPLPLRACLPRHYPTDAEILDALCDRLAPAR